MNREQECVTVGSRVQQRKQLSKTPLKFLFLLNIVMYKYVWLSYDFIQTKIGRRQALRAWLVSRRRAFYCAPHSPRASKAWYDNRTVTTTLQNVTNWNIVTSRSAHGLQSRGKRMCWWYRSNHYIKCPKNVLILNTKLYVYIQESTFTQNLYCEKDQTLRKLHEKQVMSAEM